VKAFSVKKKTQVHVVMIFIVFHIKIAQIVSKKVPIIHTNIPVDIQ